MTSSDYDIRQYSDSARRAAETGSATPRLEAGVRAAYGRASLRRRAQSGQSLIIAIAVLFLLAFIAALFITLLQRNLERTNRASQVLTADFYAQAGIRYADQMLTTSPQGADWRPPVRYYLGDSYATLSPDPNTDTSIAQGTTFTLGTTTLSSTEGNAYLAYVNSSYTSNSPVPRLYPINANDPDKFWLAQGFSRYGAQGGRYLIRITYGVGNGSGSDPYEEATGQYGKYIRIESVGRTGVVDDTNPADPTVFTNAAQPTRLNSTLVAFKPIGLTDYARFITNRDQRSDTFGLGVPSRYNTVAAASNTMGSSPITAGVNDFTSNGNSFELDPYPLVTTYGGSATMSGGSLRCNGNLRLYGMNVAFLNQPQGDDWEIAGNLTFDGYSETTTGGVTMQSTTNPAALQIVSSALSYNTDATPSNSADYNTVNGLVRDGGSGNDDAGYARDIQRLNPPAIDSLAPGTGGVEHYAALTDHGGSDGPYVKETSGGPATVYIDNTADAQPESTSAQTGSTLREDWLNPQKSANWDGPFYNPPGATIVFGPQYLNLTNGSVHAGWGFTVTRSDTSLGSDNQSHVTWHWNGDSSSAPLTASTCTFVYGAAPTGFTSSATNPVFFIGADAPPQATDPNTGQESVDNDIVIYAEGNVRVRGTVSPSGTANGTATAPTVKDPISGDSIPSYPHHVTIVSNQIAYIEGSLLKGDAVAASPPTTQSVTAKSSIALLARRYVTVNTTQFLAGAVQSSDLAQQQVDAAPGGPGSTGALDFGADGSLTETFDLPPTEQGSVTPSLFVSEYSSGSGSENSSGLLHLVEIAFDGTTSPFDTTLDGSTTANTTAPTLNGSPATPNRIVIPLSSSAFNPVFPASPGPPADGFDQFSLTFSKSPSSLSDYELAKAAILPSDVRIEAVLYAQDNSFFVIPGDWFNDDASDTAAGYYVSYEATPTAASNRPRPVPGNQNNIQGGLTDPRFPMYGQPIDMKIIIDGSVSENVPADVSDQSAWMQHWGWIPKYHGDPTQNVTSPHPAIPATALESTNGAPSTAAPDALPSAVAGNLPKSGLTFIYDADETQLSTSSRTDPYGRPLPFTPNLPVSPDLLYSGQPTGNSLVQ